MEADLDKLFRDLAEYPDEKVMEKPADGGWSILEVMQHMVLVEEASLAYAKKKSSYPDNFKKADWKNGMRKIALAFFLKSPIKFNAPQLANETRFDPEADRSDLVEKWRSVRLEMMNFLEETPDEYLDKLIFRHVFAGRMTLDGMLLFIRDHFRRHRKQIDRILKK